MKDILPGEEMVTMPYFDKRMDHLVLEARFEKGHPLCQYP